MVLSVFKKKKNLTQSTDPIICPSFHLFIHRSIYPPPHPVLLMDDGVFVEAVKLNFVDTSDEETLPKLRLSPLLFPSIPASIFSLSLSLSLSSLLSLCLLLHVHLFISDLSSFSVSCLYLLPFTCSSCSPCPTFPHLASHCPFLVTSFNAPFMSSSFLISRPPFLFHILSPFPYRLYHFPPFFLPCPPLPFTPLVVLMSSSSPIKSPSEQPHWQFFFPRQKSSLSLLSGCWKRRHCVCGGVWMCRQSVVFAECVFVFAYFVCVCFFLFLRMVAIFFFPIICLQPLSSLCSLFFTPSPRTHKHTRTLTDTTYLPTEWQALMAWHYSLP